MAKRVRRCNEMIVEVIFAAEMTQEDKHRIAEYEVRLIRETQARKAAKMRAAGEQKVEAPQKSSDEAH